MRGQPIGLPVAACRNRIFHARASLSTCACFLQALAKYAFGLGLLQMFLCTAAFTLFALPVGNGIGTQILEKVRCIQPLSAGDAAPKAWKGEDQGPAWTLLCVRP